MSACFTPRGGLLLVLCIGAMGCGQSDRQSVHPVRGQVIYDGKPIPHATIVLHPLDARAKDVPRPRGTVTEDGSFVLATYESNDGAPAGEYAVTVEWWQSNDKQSPDAPPTNRLPGRYASAAKSGLRFRVEPGDNQIPTIRLSR